MRITETIFLDERELTERYIQSPGPGGQHVNKAATSVQLRFDVQGSTSLSPEVKNRLRQFAGKRLTKEGMLIITAHSFRSRERNRQDARQRLAHLIRRATRVPKRRYKTTPPRGARERRLQAKKHRSKKKRLRHPHLALDD
ncbi:MAG: aminoacyl-tRNA hydrolase [Anaerolineales bacterium]|nr:aminoacyl-tRNA hydrolase [Anaerolineales bacterium]MCK5634199.1 aminoacyl-tRNA hydrolase [Anaerolineales bacterium]